MKQIDWAKWTRKVIQRSEKAKPSMKLYAQEYFEEGIPVVPLKIWWNEKKKQYDKQPLVEWKKWQTEGQTQQEFAALPWEQANGYAVVLGWKTKDGLFLSVVDYDVKGGRISEEGKAKGKEILDKFFPETRVECTANNGLHYLYFSYEPVENISKYHDACGLELLGKRLVVMAPSVGYTPLNDKQILQVKDLEHIFSKSIKAAGLEKKKQGGSRGRRRSGRKQKIRPCIEALLKKNALSHEERCAVAFEYLNLGYSLDEVVKLFQHQTDFDYAKTKQQLEHAKANGYVPYGEDKLKEMEVCLGPTCEQYGKQQIFTPAVVLDDGRIIEQGYDGEEVYYIVYDPKTQTITKEDFIELEEKVYIPILNEDVENGLVKLPSEAIEYDNDAQLDEEIKAYLNHWHEQLDPVQRQLDVYYTKETYIKDLLPQIAYRRNLAKFGGGKSTFLEVLGAICYRSFSVAGCSTEAAVRRTFNLWRGTAILDEADFKDASLYATIVKILNIGFDSRTGYYKCCDESDPTKILAFYVYGPKVIATRERYKDTALESRCLTTFGRQNIHRLPLFRMGKFESEAQDLRNKLLMWRFRNYHKLKEQLTVLEQIDAEEKVYGEVIDVRSRVKQIVLPLLLVVETKEERNNLSDFARAFDANLQNLDEECEWEDQISIALHKIFENESEISIISEISIVYRQGGYKVYLLDFADALEIEDPKARNYWCRGLSKYFKKRTDFPIRKGTNNRAYVLLPKFYVDEILKKPLPLSYHANSANYANSYEPQEEDGPNALANYTFGGERTERKRDHNQD